MLREAARDLVRLRRVTGIIGKYGYDELVRKSPDLPDELDTGDFVGSGSADLNLSGPARFRAMLEELGPTFIKLGQVLSSRPDLISRPYVDELKKLQDNCEPLAFGDIKKAIEENLGKETQLLFKEIDETPLATASIAQVHRAVTLEDKEVVIKVQRPGVDVQVRSDVDLLYRVARFLNVVIEESEMAEPIGIVREFEKGLLEELNFTHEAENIFEFGRLHEKRSAIVVPKVFSELSSSRVLTMSYLHGTPFSRLPASVDKKDLTERIIKEAFDEVFVDGVFHADPHPGNLLLLDDGRIGILDLGLLGRLTPQMKDTLVVLALAISVRDADSVARSLYRLGQSSKRVDISAVKKETESLFNRYLGRQIRDIDAQLVTQELLSLAMKHKIRVPSEYTMLGRAGATIEGLVREFDPEADVSKIAKPYAEQLLVGRVVPDSMKGELLKALLQIQGASSEVPLQLSQIVSDLSAGNLEVMARGPELERLNRTLMMAAVTVSVAILAGSAVIGAFIGLAELEFRFFGLPVVGLVGAGIALTTLFWLVSYVLLRPKVKKVSLFRLLFRKRP